MTKENLKLSLFALLISLIIGLFPLQAEANDTRNRLLTYDFNLSDFVLEWDRELDPYEGTSVYNRSGTATINGNVGLVTDGNSISFINQITFNRYHPAGLHSSPHETAPQSQWYIQLWDSPSGGGLSTNFTLNFNHIEYITHNDQTFLKSIGLKDFSTYSYYKISPNCRYRISIANLPLSSYKSVGNRYYDMVYDSQLDKIIGVHKASYGTNRAAAYYKSDSGGIVLYFYTPASPPAITVSNITTNKADIAWSNVNPEKTSYTLQYRNLTGTDVSNESHWSAWQDIAINGSNNTTSLGTTATIFQQDKTYQLRVRVHHIGGSNLDVFSNYVIFSTSADPAVRAAYEAAIAAQSAKEAAEQTRQYSLDAKQSADLALQQINNPTYGLESIYNKIQTVENQVRDIKFPPTVDKLIGINNTTATLATSVLVELVVDNANICRYKVNNGDYSDWVRIDGVDYMSVELGNTSGMKNITMQFAQGMRDEGENYIILSPLKSKGLKIFKL